MAQEDYRPGYVINQQGDTLKGTVLFRNGLAKHQSVTFKNNQGQESTYQPADIAAYGFKEGGFYEAVAAKAQFMEVLVLGRLDLLAVVGNLFLRDTTGNIHPLESIRKESEKQGTTYVFEQKEYLGILRWQMADCKKVQSKIREIPLEIKPMARLVSQYNACFGEKKILAAAQSTRRQQTWRVGPILGYSQGKINKLGGESYLIMKSGTGVQVDEFADANEFTKINAFTYGLYVNAGLHRVHEGLSLTLEAVLQDYELSSSRSYEFSASRVYHNSISASVRYIKTPLYVQYEWTGSRRIQPLIFGGLAFNFYSSKGSGDVTGNTVEDRPGHFVTTRVYTDGLEVKTFIISVLGGVGLRASVSERFSLDLKARYEWGSGPFYFSTWSTSGETSSYRLLGASLGCSYKL
jgi:hypothetical protein